MARVNLCANPACKNNATGWSGPVGSGRTTGLTDVGRTTGFLVSGAGDAQPPRTAVTPGLSYTFSAYLKGTGGASTGTTNINWYSGGAYLSSATTQAWTVGAGAVTRISSSATAPPTADQAVLTVEGIDNALVITSVLYEQGNTLQAFFDGDSEDSSWDGADGSSTSTTTVGSPGGGGGGGGGTPPSSTEAAVVHGWGTPIVDEQWADLDDWGLYDGPGHGGNGTRDPERISVSGGIMTMVGTAGGSTGGMAHNLNQQYGRWEFRARWYATGSSGNSYHPVLIVWPESDAWPNDGEYDLVENWIGDAVPEAWIHYPHPNLPVEQEHGVYPGTVDMGEWHNWAIDWQPDGITGYLDGVEWYHFADGAGPGGRSDIQDMPSGHATIQLDNFFGGGMQPAALQVDWMKVYTYDSVGAVPTSQTVTVTAGIASAQAFGRATINQLNRLLPGGIGSAQAFGTPSFATGIQVTSILSLEDFGTAAFLPDQETDPTGIESGELFGTPVVARQLLRARIKLFARGIPTAEAFGIPVAHRARWRLHPPERVDRYRIPYVREWRYITNVTPFSVFGDDDGLIVQEVPSADDLSAAKYVWLGGHDNITDSVAIRNLWLASDLDVETFYDGI